LPCLLDDALLVADLPPGIRSKPRIAALGRSKKCRISNGGHVSGAGRQADLRALAPNRLFAVRLQMRVVQRASTLRIPFVHDSSRRGDKTAAQQVPLNIARFELLDVSPAGNGLTEPLSELRTISVLRTYNSEPMHVSFPRGPSW